MAMGLHHNVYWSECSLHIKIKSLCIAGAALDKVMKEARRQKSFSSFDLGADINRESVSKLFMEMPMSPMGQKAIIVVSKDVVGIILEEVFNG